MTTTDEVPGKYDVGINGHGYMIDTQFLEAYQSRTVDPIRRQGDSSSSVGESSLNPEGYWRRSPESWHKGAGQTRYDAADSDEDRFLSSRGVDVWTEGQLSLLEDATAFNTTATSLTILDAVSTGTGAVGIVNGGGDLHVYYSSFSSYRVVTSPQSDVTDVATDGTTVWYVDDGHLYEELVTTLEAGTAATSPWITDDPTNITGVKYCGGRLLCHAGGNVYDVSATSIATLPTALGELPGGDFQATYANGYIYMTTSASSDVYMTTVKSDGSGLEVPTVAGSLPTGDSVLHMYGYLNFVVFYLNISERGAGQAGLRLGLAGSDGDLTFGETFLYGDMDQGTFVGSHMLTSGRFVYLPGHTGTAASAAKGLVRLDLSVVNDALVPAFASDIEVEGAAVLAEALSGDVYVLRQDGEVWRTDDYVSSGVLDMGDVTFSTRENKLFLDPLDTTEDGTVTHTLTTPDGTTYPNANVATPEPSVSWQMALNPTTSGEDMTVQYPILRALPAPSPIDETTVPLLLHRTIEDRQGAHTSVDTQAERTYLEGLRDGALIDFQDGAVTKTAQVIGVAWQAAQRDLNGDQWDGTAVVKLKVLS